MQPFWITKTNRKSTLGAFSLNKPNRIGFMPDPLVFVCSECQRLVEFQDVVELDRRWSGVDQSARLQGVGIGATIGGKSMSCLPIGRAIMRD